MLTFFYNRISHFDAALSISGNLIKNIKKEIVDEYNCLNTLKAYFASLEDGKIAEHESKIILIGNGRVGKTCIINRWLYDIFNEEESTHGINITGRNFKEEAEKNHLENLRLNIWDFGGQDIYHATHRYFMQTNALFLLVWDAKTESQTEQEEKFSTGKKVKYKNYSIRHWLSYIKTQGKNSPVIIVQTKRDEYPGDEPDFTSAEKKEFNIKAIIAIESSNNNEDENGYDILKKAIFRLMAEQLKKNNAPLPAQWFKIKEKIWAIQEKNNKKSGSGKKGADVNRRIYRFL